MTTDTFYTASLARERAPRPFAPARSGMARPSVRPATALIAAVAVVLAGASRTAQAQAPNNPPLPHFSGPRAEAAYVNFRLIASDIWSTADAMKRLSSLGSAPLSRR